MNEQQTNEEQPQAQGAAHERCLCYELLDLFRARVGVSPAVRQHSGELAGRVPQGYPRQ